MTHKLLLADDSVTIQRVIELTFADEDVEVTTVGDGQLAIDRLDSDPPDIVLADVDMPKRDGYEVAAYVKSRPKLAHIPVVLLTGAFEPIDHARAAAAGSSDVLAKPFEPQMVINRVKELLGRKRQEEPEQYERPAAPMPLQQPQVGNPTPSGEGVQQPVSLDDYFDQLDAAFANIQPGAAPVETSEDNDWAAVVPMAKSTATSAPQSSVAVAPQPPSGAQASHTAAPPAIDLDWIATIDPQVPYEPPQSDPAPVAHAHVPLVAPVAHAAPVVPIAPTPVEVIAPVVPTAPAMVMPPPVAQAPPIAEAPPVAQAAAPVTQAPPVAATAPSAPRSNPFANLTAAKAEAAARAAAPVITDEIIEEVVARVLQRLSDKVVRETVTDIVTQTAERLVQDEIDRIRETGQ
jgi:CheY-like chemotaxis protein